jgi:hypothetical protein
MLDLIKNRKVPPDGASSAGLAMLREIALWWRALQLTSQCRLTALLLKRLGCFDAVVAGYFQANSTSPYIEQIARDFLHWLGNHEDPLVRAMAHFELAFVNARDGSDATVEVLWDRHPDKLFEALQRHTPLPGPEPDCVYRMRVGKNVPALMDCRREFHATLREFGHVPSR